MQRSQTNKYLQNTIQTVSPAQLLIMLVDGGIRFLRQGVEAIKEKKYSDANTYLLKTQDIVSEFIITLDRKSPLAENLLRLYEYFNSRLMEANLKKDVAPAEEVLSYLIDLKETWIQAAKQSNQQAGNVNGSNNRVTQPTVV